MIGSLTLTERRWRHLWVVAAAAAVLWLFAAPPPAYAHSALIDTDPADGQVLPDAPSHITLTFNEPVAATPQGNQLLHADGTPMAVDVTSSDKQLIITPRDELDQGTFVVGWRIVSDDSHPISGAFTFSVGEPSSTVVDLPEESSDTAVTAARIAAEALRYGGVLGFAGLVWFDLFVARGARQHSPRFDKRVRAGRRWFLGAAAVGSVLLIPLVKLWQEGRRLVDIVDPAVWSSAITDDTAIAAAVVGVGLALVAAARNRVPELAAIGLALMLGSLVIVGHTRVFGPVWLVLAADLLHVATAALWFGGLIGLSMILGKRNELAVRDVAAAVGRFSTAALWLVIGVGAAAVVLWWRITESIEALWTSDYGILVLVKAGVVALVLLVAAWNKFRLVPAVVAGGDSPDGLARLRRTVGFETVALIGVVIATAVLVAQSPPSAQAADAAHHADGPIVATAGSTKATATIELDPHSRGANTVHVTLVGADGAPLEPIQAPELSIRLPDNDIGPFQHELEAADGGGYTATVNFPLPGTWTVTVGVRISEFENPILMAEVTIP